MTLGDLWPGFQGHDIFLWSNIGKTARLKDKVTIAQEEKYTTYGMVHTMFDDLTDLNASRGFVSISWADCYTRDTLHSAVFAVFVRVRHRPVLCLNS